MTGFAAAQGEYIVMADADLTYDFHEIPRFLAELEAGGDLVMGDRFQKIHPGAMRDARDSPHGTPPARSPGGRHGVRAGDDHPRC
jgi:hypothetical protein